MNDLPIVTDQGAPRPERATKPSRAGKGGGSPAGIIMLSILSLLGFGALGWFTWSINSTMNVTLDNLGNVATRIEALESRLVVNEESILDSDASVTGQLAFWESEIRKLWDIANKRNKDDIADNTAAISQMSNDVTARINSMKGSLTDIENTVTQIARQQRSLSDDLGTTVQQSKALLEQLESKVQSNQEGVEASDSSRRQTNQKLLDLERRLRNLELEN